MSFIVEQVRNGRTYVYEASSYRDRKTGAPRQKRRYLGVKDVSSGEVRPARRSIIPRMSLDFGATWLIYGVVRNIELDTMLSSALGSDLARRVISLAVYSATGGDAMYLYRDWAERTWGVAREQMSSQDISRLFSSLGAMGRERESFWMAWARKHGEERNLVFDVTSISGYGESVDMLEWGYNRDGESLPQINIGLMMGEKNLLPLGYRTYPGSIPDMKMLVNLLEYFRKMGLVQSRVILDRGFFSSGNIKSLAEHGYSFLIPMPFTSSNSKSLIHSSLRRLESPDNFIEFNGRIVGHVRRKVKVADVSCEAHVFCDEKRRAAEKENLMRKIMMVEREISGKMADSTEEALSRAEAISPDCSKLLDVSVDKGLIHVSRNAEKMACRMIRMGMMILLSADRGLQGKDVLRDYYRKEFLEKFFDAYKNEIGQNRLRIHSEDSMEGRIFVAMIALCIHCSISARMRKSELNGKMSLPEMLGKLKLIRTVEFSDGKYRRTEMTSVHRKIYEALESNPPPVETEKM